MTKEKPGEHSEALFTEADIISSYTDAQAVEDGVLFAVQELSKLSPRANYDKGPFQYVTTNLCSKGYLKDGVPQVANFLDLFVAVERVLRERGPDDFYTANVEFPDGTTGEVYAARNESGRYTLLLPEDY